MENPQPQRLDYQDRSFVWVFPDDLKFVEYTKVDWYAQQIAEEVSRLMPTVDTKKLTTIDQLYTILDATVSGLVNQYYSFIGDILSIPKIEELTPVSRHSFFVHQLKLEPEGILVEPSRLQLLMGHGAFDNEEKKSDKEVPTSGNLICDVEVSLRMTFKHTADDIMRNRGLVYCFMALKQASAQMALAQKEAEKERKNSGKNTPMSIKKEPVLANIERKALDPDFVEDRAQIFETLGIEMPES